MAQAGFDTSKPWHIYFKVAGEPKREVQLDTVLDLETPGIEKLRLSPRDVGNGEAPPAPHRDFALLDVDAEYLDRIKLRWETIEEDDQRVALLGMDLTYYLDFFEHFEGNPEGMRFSLERTWGAETVTWNEFDQVQQGDSMHIRQFEVNAETSMFVLAPKSDSMLFTFLPPTIQSSPALAADMMNNETMLTLLRHKREHFDKQ